MKKILLILVLLFSINSYSQNPTRLTNGITIGDPSGTSADPSFLQTEINFGTIYWNSTLGEFRRWDGTSWNNLSVDSAQFTSLQDEGMVVTKGTGNTFSVSSGQAISVDNHTTPLFPSATPIVFAGVTDETITRLFLDDFTFLAISPSGTILQQGVPFSQESIRINIPLGTIVHIGGVVTTVVSRPILASNTALLSDDIIDALGIIKKGGIVVGANGANLSINISTGEMMGRSLNYDGTVAGRKSPNLTPFAGMTAGSVREFFRDGTGGVVLVAPSVFITPGFVDDGSGTLVAISANNYVTRRVFVSATGLVFIAHGQRVYSSISDAVRNLLLDPFAGFVTEILNETVLSGAIILRGGATDLSDETGSFPDANFANAGKLGSLSSGAIGGNTDLQGAYNNSIEPEITTNVTQGALTIQRGSAADTDNVFEIENGAGSTTFSVDGNGNLTSIGIDDNATSTAITIQSDGDVGIGTLTPLTLATISKNNSVIYDGTDVNGQVSGTSTLAVENEFSGLGEAFSQVLFTNRANTSRSRIVSITIDDVTKTDLAFITENNVTALTEKMRITSNGNVGIGTTSPAEKLEVIGNISSESFRSSRSDGDIFILSKTAGDFVSIGTQVSTNLLRVQGDGNVGIGTTSPGTKLHLQGSVGELLRLEDTAGGGSPHMSFHQAGTRRALIQYFGTDPSLRLINEFGHIRFDTAPSGTELERMRITDLGNIGIGTSTPLTLLHLDEGGTLPSILGGGTRLLISDTSGLISDSVSISLLAKASNGFSIINFGDETSQFEGNIKYTHSDDSFSIRTDGFDRLFIDSLGNLGLGINSFGTNGATVFALANGTPPTTSPANSIQLYAEDVTASSELKVRDEAGNVTVLSPHNFTGIPQGKSEQMAWSFYSERDGKTINVDMLKVVRLLEKLTGEKLVFIKDK